MAPKIVALHLVYERRCMVLQFGVERLQTRELFTEKISLQKLIHGNIIPVYKLVRGTVSWSKKVIQLLRFYSVPAFQTNLGFGDVYPNIELLCFFVWTWDGGRHVFYLEDGGGAFTVRLPFLKRTHELIWSMLNIVHKTPSLYLWHGQDPLWRAYVGWGHGRHVLRFGFVSTFVWMVEIPI